jgi:hypothetical protein
LRIILLFDEEHSGLCDEENRRIRPKRGSNHEYQKTIPRKSKQLLNRIYFDKLRKEALYNQIPFSFSVSSFSYILLIYSGLSITAL